jgi:hypothetical protein
MSRSRPDGILVRIVIITLFLVLVSYFIFGLVAAFTDDQYKLLRGKLIMLGSLMLVGILLGLVVTPVITTIRQELDVLID